MNEMKPIAWIGALAIAGFLLYLVLAYMNPNNVGNDGVILSHGAEKAAQASIVDEHKKTAASTAKGKAATASADSSQAVANTARQKAIYYHQQARAPHAIPTPTSDTAVARIQSALAAYGN
jgi:hypothetical protein